MLTALRLPAKLDWQDSPCSVVLKLVLGSWLCLIVCFFFADPTVDQRKGLATSIKLLCFDKRRSSLLRSKGWSVCKKKKNNFISFYSIITSEEWPYQISFARKFKCIAQFPTCNHLSYINHRIHSAQQKWWHFNHRVR